MQSVSSNAVYNAISEFVKQKNLIYKITDSGAQISDNAIVDIGGLSYGEPYLLINTHALNVDVQCFIIFNGTVRVYNIFASSPLDITYVNSSTVRVSSTGRNARAGVWKVGNMYST